MIPQRGITSPVTSMMLLERSLGVTTVFMSCSEECGDTQAVLERSGHTTNGIQSTGKVEESRLSGSVNELSLPLILKVDCVLPRSLYVCFLFICDPFTCEPVLLRTTPLYT